MHPHLFLSMLANYCFFLINEQGYSFHTCLVSCSAKWPPLQMGLKELSNSDYLDLSSRADCLGQFGAYPKTQTFIGERVRINSLFARWIDFIVFSFCLFFSVSPCFLSPLSGGCEAGARLNIISHGDGKCYTGKSAAQCAEKPALPPAGPCQHVEGAAHRDPQITAAMHR